MCNYYGKLHTYMVLIYGYVLLFHSLLFCKSQCYVLPNALLLLYQKSRVRAYFCSIWHSARWESRIPLPSLWHTDRKHMNLVQDTYVRVCTACLWHREIYCKCACILLSWQIRQNVSSYRSFHTSDQPLHFYLKTSSGCFNVKGTKSSINHKTLQHYNMELII